MARKQSPKQQEIVGRVMHEFKHGQLDSSSGRKVKNPRQAIAIALHEAGASRDETPAGNRRNLARTKAKERQAGTARDRRQEGPGTVAGKGRRGADAGGALQRSHEARDRRPLPHDQGAARASPRSLRRDASSAESRTTGVDLSAKRPRYPGLPAAAANELLALPLGWTMAKRSWPAAPSPSAVGHGRRVVAEAPRTHGLLR